MNVQTWPDSKVSGLAVGEQLNILISPRHFSICDVSDIVQNTNCTVIYGHWDMKSYVSYSSISRGKSYQLVILPISIVWLSVYWGDNCLLAAMFSGSLRVFSLPSHNEQAPLSGKVENPWLKNGPALDSGQSQSLPQDATLLMAGQHSLESTSSSTIPSDRLGLSESTPIPAPDKRSNEVSVGILLTVGRSKVNFMGLVASRRALYVVNLRLALIIPYP